MSNKRKIAIFLAAIGMIMLLVGCGQSVKDKAIAEVKAVKESAYMMEDQKDIKVLKSDYVKALEKAKADKDVKKVIKQFRVDLKTFATKKSLIAAYKKLVLEQAGQEAEKILKEYDKKFATVKSKADLETLTAEINAKLTERTGKTVEVTTSQVETSTPAAKQIAKQQSKQGSTTSGSSGASSHAKQRIWVVDKAAWTETKYKQETYTYTVYIVNGREFTSYDAAYSYWCQLDDQGIATGSFGPSTKTGTRQVPYTVTHPEVGHWEYR